MTEILIIEDEKDIVQAIEYNLSKEGYFVSKAYDGFHGLKLAEESIPSLIILDLMLPGIDGFEICRRLKKSPKTALIPIIMLTAKGGETDKIVGLELGAEDYIVKPFSLKELVTRIKVVLRRYEKAPRAKERVIKIKEILIDPDKHEVTVSGKAIDLTAKEFQLLQYLAENPGRAFSRDRLLDTVWGINTEIETRTVDVHVRRLREKLHKAGKYITTLRGVGYKLTA